MAPRTVLALAGLCLFGTACDPGKPSAEPPTPPVETPHDEIVRVGAPSGVDVRPDPIARPEGLHRVDPACLGTIEGKVSFSEPIMAELVERRPAPFFTVFFLEFVPEDSWAHDNSSPGRSVDLVVDERYRGVHWGVNHPEDGWIAWPAAVVALEVGESVRIVFPPRFVTRYRTPSIFNDAAWDDPIQGRLPSGCLPGSDGHSIRLYPLLDYPRLPTEEDDLAAYAAGPFVVGLGGTTRLRPDHVERIHIVGMQNPFHTTVDLGVAREFRIENVPPGEWYVRAYDAHLTGAYRPSLDPQREYGSRTIREPVVVQPGRVSAADIVFGGYRDGVSPLAVRGEDPTPTDAPGFVERGIERFVYRDPRGAIEDLEKAIALDPDCWPAWTCLGVVHARGRRWQDAERAFERAMDLAPLDRRHEVEELRNSDPLSLLLSVRTLLGMKRLQGEKD